MADVFFVTGAPRSGTTFLSDWITESPDAYCAHEILDSLSGKPPREITEYLQYCAATGADRLEKPMQREFMEWDSPRIKNAPRLIGFKEPYVWRSLDALPYALCGYLKESNARCVVVIRHPYDVIISGKRRAVRTANWPDFSVEAHCDFWRLTASLPEFYTRKGLTVLFIRWEQLVLESPKVQKELEDFLRIRLPFFNGYERGQDYLNSMRDHVTISGGVGDRNLRGILSNEEQVLIRTKTAGLCATLGYDL